MQLVSPAVAPSPPKAASASMQYHPLWLRFDAASEEAAFQRAQFLANRPGLLLALLLLLPILFVSATDNFASSTIPIIIFLVGRLLPVLGLLGVAALAMPRFCLWWSLAACAAVAIATAALHVLHFECTQASDAAAHMWSCGAVTGHSLAWLSVTCQSVLPFVLSPALGASWWHSLLATLASYAVYVGLLIPRLHATESAAGIVLPLLFTALACVGAYRCERAVRQAWRSVAASDRVVASALNVSVSASVASGQGKRLSQALARAPVFLYELGADGLFNYIAPSCANIVGACRRGFR